MHPYLYSSYSGASPVMMIGIWVIQLLIAWFILLDVKEQKMLGPVWVILAIIPMFGLLTDAICLVIREIWIAQKPGALQVETERHRNPSLQPSEYRRTTLYPFRRVRVSTNKNNEIFFFRTVVIP
jgi:hypothetical protein